MKKILLFPFNGNAREAAGVIEDINRQRATWKILGFIDDDPAKQNCKFGDYSVIGGQRVIAEEDDAFILAVPGRPENYLKRGGIIASLGLQQSRFATIIHPTATIGINCTVGRNSLLMANVVLTAKSYVGSSVVILPNSVISHDTRVEDFSMIGSNVSISGSVSCKKNCYIGSGSRVIQEVTIGRGALVGIGSVVIDDIAPDHVVAGNPARIIRSM